MKIRTYFVSRVRIRGLPPEHRATNGSPQKSVVIKAKSMSRVAEILQTTIHYLRMHGCHIRPDYSHLAPKPETIYYEPEHTVSGFLKGYIELPERQLPNSGAQD